MLHLSGVSNDTAGGEFDDAACRCKQGIVLSLAHIQARTDFGTALTDNDIACFGVFSSVQLYAESLAL